MGNRNEFAENPNLQDGGAAQASQEHLDKILDHVYKPVMVSEDAQNPVQMQTQASSEPIDRALRKLPFPAVPQLYAQILGVTTDPLPPCDGRPQSPAMTGEPVKDTCQIELSKVMPSSEKSSTQAIAWQKSGKPNFGTSFLLCDKECYYVTNNHVAGDSDTVGIVSQDGKTIEYGKILNRDADKDIVIVERPDGDSRPPVAVGSSVGVGESVFIIGHPFGSPWKVMTAGHVLQLHKNLDVKDPESGEVTKYKDLIASDVVAMPGNSGGPEFNAKGEVVSVKALASRGGSFSIPIQAAIEEIKEVEAKKASH